MRGAALPLRTTHVKPPLNRSVSLPMPHATEIHTPLGRIVASGFVSAHTKYKLRVSTFPIIPKLPEGMSVAGCHAALFDLRAKGSIRSIEFSLLLENRNALWGADTGEGLESYSVAADGYIVQVGTEDGDVLAERLGKPKLSTQERYPFSISKQEMTQTIRDLDVRGRITLHYVVAWSRKPEPVESSCWYAVDIPHSKVMESAS